jgi:CheY-like chemotaxis protein
MEQKSILVIEDNKLNMKLVRGIISTTTYEMIEAVDAETGLTLARKRLPDLILMDIQLPGMDGLSATKVIKNEKALGDIPVIAVTSYAMQGDREKAIEAGCDGHVTKPFDAKTLREIIDKYLS